MRRAALIAPLALLLDLAPVAGLVPPGAWTRTAAILVPALLCLGHFSPRRGRSPGVLAAAGLLAAALAIAGLAAWETWAPRGALAAIAAACALAPWPGHVLALLPGVAPALPAGRPLARDPMARAYKRATDVIGALLAGTIAIPLIAVATPLVRLTTPGPAFYSQTRVTRGGRVFRIWKLRTMVRDAECGTPVWPEENDPRITGLGRVLRLLWIDELPQLWNVLRGDMSLIGPRPERPEFVEEFAARMPIYRERHSVAGGITGLAQALGFIGNTSIRRRLALDLHYVRAWRPCLDLWILTCTVIQALGRAVGWRTHRADATDRPSGTGGGEREFRSGIGHLPERDQRH